MQIWIEPEEKGLEPKYADQPLVGAEDDEWSLILSPDGRDGSIKIRQDATLQTVRLKPGSAVGYAPAGEGRGLWLFVIEGKISSDGEEYGQGDSVALTVAGKLELSNAGTEPAKVLLFDLPV
jgi:redox-sensitive bicupin YhaK (pirin superfamily)